MPDQRTRRNADTRARLEEQRLARQNHRRESVVEAVVNEHAIALPFVSYAAAIDNGSPSEVGQAVDNLQLIEQEYAPRLLGRALIRMKAELPHGEWLQWVAMYWHKSDREARSYMRFARGETPALHARNVAHSAGSNRKHSVQIASDLTETEDTNETIVIDVTPREHHCDFEQRLRNCARMYRAMVDELSAGLKGNQSVPALKACIVRTLEIAEKQSE